MRLDVKWLTKSKSLIEALKINHVILYDLKYLNNIVEITKCIKRFKKSVYFYYDCDKDENVDDPLTSILKLIKEQNYCLTRRNDHDHLYELFQKIEIDTQINEISEHFPNLAHSIHLCKTIHQKVEKIKKEKENELKHLPKEMEWIYQLRHVSKLPEILKREEDTLKKKNGKRMENEKRKLDQLENGNKKVKK